MCAGALATARHPFAAALLGRAAGSKYMVAAIPSRIPGIYLRPSVSEDEDFLRELHAEQQVAELEASGLDTSQCEIFLRIQFRARQLSYSTYYPSASDQIVCLEDGTPIGRILVARSVEGTRVIDIALIRKQQRRGLGTRLLQNLKQECTGRGRELRLQVLKGSAAERLYLRLGFVHTGEDAFRRQMVWTGGSHGTHYERITQRVLCQAEKDQA